MGETVHNVKCMNTQHKMHAENILKQTVWDYHTMHVNVENSIATLHCPWCEYKVTVDLAIRPLIVEFQSGKEMTIRASS